MTDQPAAHHMVAGDLNARIGNLQDFIPHDEVDFIFGENDYPSDLFDTLIKFPFKRNGLPYCEARL